MGRFQIKEFTVSSPKFHMDSKEYHTAVLISDLHNYCYGEHNCLLLEAIDSINPEFILCAGDMLIGHSRHSIQPALEFMQAIGEKYQVYAVNGNHEHRMKVAPEVYQNQYESYKSGLLSGGVTLLENREVIVPYSWGSLRIYGYELPQAYYRKSHQPQFQKEELVQTLGACKEEYYNILLSHNPVYFQEYADWGADLTVSGHLHGGIIRLPFLGGIITPQYKLFPKYDRGLYEIEGHKLLVSPGLGNHSVPRIANPPWLMVIRFFSES